MVATLILMLLGVLAAVLLVLTLSLVPRAGIEAVGVNGEVSADVRYGWLRIPIWPLAVKHKKKQSAQTAEKEKPPAKRQKQKKYSYTLNKEELDIGVLVSLALTLLDELSDTLRISRLRVRVLFGTDDAAKTGILLGQTAALTGMIVPFLENTFDMRDYRVSADADFEADHTEWAFTVFCSLRPVRLVWVLLRHSREFYRLYKRLIRKEEANCNE